MTTASYATMMTRACRLTPLVVWSRLVVPAPSVSTSVVHDTAMSAEPALPTENSLAAE